MEAIDLATASKVSASAQTLTCTEFNRFVERGVLLLIDYTRGARERHSMVVHCCPPSMKTMRSTVMISVRRQGSRSALPRFGTVLRGLLLAFLGAWLPSAPALAVPPSQPLLLSPGQGALVNGPTVLFQWTTDPAADNYCITLATDPGFTALLASGCLGRSGQVNVTELDDNGLPVFWRVQAFLGAESSLSETGQFVNGPSGIPGPATGLLPAEGSNAPGAVVQFRWQPAPRAANYVLEVAGSPDFADANTFYRKNLGNVGGANLGGFPAIAGLRYYWRLTANNSAGTGPSLVQSFFNGPALSLAPASGEGGGAAVISARSAPRIASEALEISPGQ